MNHDYTADLAATPDAPICINPYAINDVVNGFRKRLPLHEPCWDHLAARVLTHTLLMATTNGLSTKDVNRYLHASSRLECLDGLPCDTQRYAIAHAATCIETTLNIQHTAPNSHGHRKLIPILSDDDPNIAGSVRVGVCPVQFRSGVGRAPSIGDEDAIERASHDVGELVSSRCVVKDAADGVFQFERSRPQPRSLIDLQ
jgi:hypothetical protein